MTWWKAYLSTEGDRWVNADRVDFLRVVEIASGQWRVKAVMGEIEHNLSGQYSTEAEANTVAARLTQGFDPSDLT